MTRIRVQRHVECPFSAALEFAEQAVSRRAEFYVSPSPPLGERVHAVASSIEDATDTVRKHEALLLAWRPQTRDIFPDFHGVLTVRPERSGVSLRLTGEYEPPYKPFGKVFDALAGRVLARRTMLNLLSDLAADIESTYQKERRNAR